MDAEATLSGRSKKGHGEDSGFQVWPREIEEVIATHPAVLEACGAGVPHTRKGEVARAWVVLKPGQTATEDELRAYCRERLAPYKVPAHVEFRADLPKTMVGKVLRRVLAARPERDRTDAAVSLIPIRLLAEKQQSSASACAAVFGLSKTTEAADSMTRP